MSRKLARMGVIPVIAALWLSLIAGPAAAAGHVTRWVDDDSSPGDGPAACDTAAYSSIQDAIDASAAGDRVMVCPGTYAEALAIPTGVKVRARPLLSATLAGSLRMGPNGENVIVNITGNNVLFRGFRITIDDGTNGCGTVDEAIIVTGQNDRIRNNAISTSGSQTLSGCGGYDYGIVVGTHDVSATARVTFNWITDFKAGGILVENEDTYAYVRRNTIRYLHEGECLTCYTVVPSQSVNSEFLAAFGIGVESHARADVIANAVYSGRDACIGMCAFVFVETPTLSWGIALTGLDGTETTNVHNNSVYRTDSGIVTDVFADGADIANNHVTHSRYAFLLSGNNDAVHGNRASLSDFGISVGGAGNNIHDNNFSGNDIYDCQDTTTGGSGTLSTDNTWTANLGATSDPAGLCSPADV